MTPEGRSQIPSEPPSMRYLFVLVVLILTAPSVWGETFQAEPGRAEELHQLLNHLESGDRLVLKSGDYFLDDGLNLVNRDDVIIEGRGKATIVVKNLNQPVLALNSCKGVQLKSLRMRHLNPGREYRCEGAVVSIRDCDKVFITKSSLNGCGAYGVYAERSKNLVIYKNWIFNNTFSALRFENTAGIVHKNVIYDNMAEILTYGNCDLTFTENKVYDNAGNSFKHTQYFEQMTGEKYSHGKLKKR